MDMVRELSLRKEKLLMSLFNQQILVTKATAKTQIANFILNCNLDEELAIEKLKDYKDTILKCDYLAIDAYGKIKGFTTLEDLVKQIIKRPKSFSPEIPEVSISHANDWLKQYERCKKM